MLLLSSIILGLKTITYIEWSFSSAGHIPIKFAVDTHCPHAVYSFDFKCPVTFVLASTKDQNMLWCTINIDLEQVLNFLVQRGCTLIYYGDTVLFKHLQSTLVSFCTLDICIEETMLSQNCSGFSWLHTALFLTLTYHSYII